MRNNVKMLLALAGLVAMTACQQGRTSGGGDDADSVAVVVHDTVPLPSVAQASVGDLDYKVFHIDTVNSGKLCDYDNQYLNAPGQLTFRGDLLRNANFGGTIDTVPSRVVEDWMFKTRFDTSPTPLGVWGGGTGWTAQPLYIHWPDSLVALFKREPAAALTPDFGPEEIMVASLCGDVCFINYATGKASREPLDAGNPTKGTMMLDPSLNGNLYVGQGVPRVSEIGHEAFNLHTRERTMFLPRDPMALRHWYGTDSSPLIVGGFLFWCSENGLIYKYLIQPDGTPTLHTVLRYTVKGDGAAAGVESSPCVYKNYCFIGDNHGDVLCINLDTMEPLWHYDNVDDIDASPVCEVVQGTPYVYFTCEVDRQGNTGMSHIVKLNGLNGQPVWHVTIPCNKLNMGGKHFDGGVYSTPLLGGGDCENLIFTNVCQRDNTHHAEFTAFDKSTGQIVYRTPLKYFAWTSPVAFYRPNGEMYIFTGDSSGNAYLIRGKTGEILFTEHMVNNFESSPVVIGNTMVVGSRGQEIYRFHIE